MPAKAKELSPGYVLAQVEKDSLFPFYLFYGENQFLLEKTINKIKKIIPDDLRDLNQQIFYGDEIKSDFARIIDAARSIPFICKQRLIIVRRADSLSASAQQGLVSYIDNPSLSTCIIFVALKPDFRKKLYSAIKNKGRAVNFKEIYDNQIPAWIKKTARKTGFDITDNACVFLHQIAGNNLSEVANELDKLFIRYGNKTTIGTKEVQEVVASSRNYTIFELIDEVSSKHVNRAMIILDRFLQQEGVEGSLQVLGMLIRQIKLIGWAKSLMSEGLPADSKHLKVHPFVVKKIIQQSKKWQTEEIEQALTFLYLADKAIKSGSKGDVVIENVVSMLCRSYYPK